MGGFRQVRHLRQAENKANGQEMLKMLQTLLEECFQLRFHREMKDLSGFELVVSKRGPAFRETSADDPRPVTYLTRRNAFAAPRVSLAYFANYLAGIVGAPVVDRTGLQEKYDIHLLFTPEGQQPDDPQALSSAPLVSALQEQLGLKLEAKKISVEVFVIDQAVKPAEN